MKKRTDRPKSGGSTSVIKEMPSPAGDTAAETDLLPNARVRVVFEHLTCILDGYRIEPAKFPVKALVGDVITLEADIFSNEDNLRTARLLYKHASESTFQEIDLMPLGNDRWSGSFRVEKSGYYVYTLEAWLEDDSSDEASPTVARYASSFRIAVDRLRAAFSTWYSLFPHSASDEPNTSGTFKDVEKRLARIAGMGFDVLCLAPIHPVDVSQIGTETGPGDPYRVGSALGGHDAISPQLGTVADFTHLLAIAHNYSMEVALDLSLRCAPNHPWVQTHSAWFSQHPDNLSPDVKNQLPVYALNFDTEDWQNLWLELKRVVLVWADWGVRLIRVDRAQTAPFAFWEWLIEEVRKEVPDLLFLAAAFPRPKPIQQLAKVGFSQSYTHFIWRQTKAEIQDYLTELMQPEIRAYLRPSFWPATYDVNPFSLQAGHEPQFLIRYFLTATLSGNYGVAGPAFELMEHEAVPGSEVYRKPESRTLPDWNWAKTNKLTYLITLVNRIRQENPALQTTYNLLFCPVSDDAIMAYLKITGTNRLLIVVNTDAYNRRAGMVQVPIDSLGIPADRSYTVHDLLTGGHYTWQGEWNYVELDPYLLPMHLLRIDIHET